MPATGPPSVLARGVRPAPGVPKSAEFLREFAPQFGNLGSRPSLTTPVPSECRTGRENAAAIETLAYGRSGTVLRGGREAAGGTDLAGQHCRDTPCVRENEACGQTPRLRPRARRLRSAAGAVRSSASVGEQRDFPIRAAAKRKSGDLGGVRPLVVRPRPSGNEAIWHRISNRGGPDTREAAETLARGCTRRAAVCLVQRN